MLRWLFIPFLSLLIISSCEKSSFYENQALVFSEDTVSFDTVFTTIGSVTRELRIKNISNKRLLIDRIYLAGRNNSPFRINIDGEPLSLASNVLIYPRDSIFIFIDVIIDPNNSNLPVLIRDSVIFEYQGKIQRVILQAWGQDIVLLKDVVIKNESWDLPKPYLIYGNVVVDTFCTLRIREGVKVLFHKNSSLIAAGRIQVTGTKANPVLFASVRFNKEYRNVPGLWNGIFILSPSNENIINHAEIRNSVFGIRLGEPGKVTSLNVPDLKLNSVNISHSTVTCLAIYQGNAEAINSVFSHSGKYCLYIYSEGEYRFVHCTFFNLWDYGIRMTPLLSISKGSDGFAGTEGITINLINSVIYGDLKSETEIINATAGASINFLFDHCLVKIDTTSALFWQREKFTGTIINKNPRFINEVGYDYRPDTLSPLINSGKRQLITDYPEDIRGVSRLSDGLPDIGAYERKPGEKKQVQ